MKLVVGLGNPEAKYNFTRHNTGFLVLDYYFKVAGLTWNAKPRLSAVWERADDVIFIKPQDYYNESGRAVLAFMQYYKLSLSDILVICDDFNLDFGIVRYRSSGSAGGNNGLKSIIGSLGTGEFARIRVGTGNDELRRKMGDVDFVLSKYTPEEKALLPAVLDEAMERMKDCLIR